MEPIHAFIESGTHRRHRRGNAVTDLGTLTGTSSGANGISNNGTYVTGSFLNGSVRHGFLYSSATGAVDLGALGNFSQGNAVNNTGQVAGYTVPSTDHAFLYSGTTMTDLGTIGGGLSSSFGYGINNLGQVVGYSNVNPANSHQYDAFVYKNGSMQDLGLPTGATSSYAASINDSGLIAGYFTPDSATTHPFTLLNGTFTDLGTLNGTASGTTGSAAYVSSNGLVVGSSVNASKNTHAFLYSGGQMTDLGTLGGTLSRASGVNASGDVVGESFWSGSGFHGFLYHGGTMLDLNSLLDSASSGYTITDATGISDTGVVVATGAIPGGGTHALLLAPASVSPQTITFDAIPNQIFGVSPFAIAVQASSGLPVTIASTTTTVCKNASGLVMLLSAGTCPLTATQGGNGSFSAATPVVRSFAVSLANPSGTLLGATGSPFAVGSEPRSVAVGDFNGDGKPDLATANYGDGTVTVLLANNSGGYTAATGSPFTVGANPQSVAVGDFNGDGFQDLAVANSGSNNVTVLLGNGSGGFTAASGSPINVGTQPVSIAVGDFNGDGIQDLALANYSSNNVTVLLGNGAGGFTAAAASPFMVGTNPQSLAVGDFNGDRAQDLAIANFGSGSVTVLLGNNLGGFTPAPNSPFTVGTTPYSVAVGDFDGNGIPDLATANSGSNNVTVLLGNGSGGFTTATGNPFSVGTSPYSVVVADFNGDGIPDLATANHGSSDVTVLLGNGAGGFAPIVGGTIGMGAGASPFSLAVADFNGDGISDLASANYGAGKVAVLLGGKVSTTSVLSTTSPATIFEGQSVPLTLTVSDTATPFSPPSGTATFLDGTASLGTATQTGTPYTFNAILGLGNHILSASYGGGGGSLPSTSSSISILAVSRCDINQDQSTNIADVQLEINEALGLKAAGNDLAGSGTVNVVDVQLVIDAVNQLGCLASL
jgi:probable HAF family extracellular repeat protein